ncbi:MAG: ATP-binding protein [Comamonadaceae bacterium]|nr:ATP-binding protein [Comamonadaceae bacterium]
MLAVSVHALQRERQRLHYEKLAAQEASRLKGEFLAHMTHELRTPLTAIMGFNKVNLLDDGLGRVERLKNSATIGRSCEHLLQLINDNLDQARMAAGQLAILPKPEDVAGLADEVAAALAPIARQKGLELRWRHTLPIPARVMIDGFRLRQVLINLVGNALRFTAEGSVDINVDWRAGTLEIVVADTGPGMGEEAVKRIFEAFQQADVALEGEPQRNRSGPHHQPQSGASDGRGDRRRIACRRWDRAFASWFPRRSLPPRRPDLPSVLSSPPRAFVAVFCWPRITMTFAR